MSVVISNRNFILNDKVTKLKDEELASFKVEYQKKPIIIPKEELKPSKEKKSKFLIKDFYF